MKIVGRRLEIPLTMKADGLLLKEGARLAESVSRLTKQGFIPKGVYRFPSHDAANRHEDECLVRSMAKLAAERRALKMMADKDRDRRNP